MDPVQDVFDAVESDDIPRLQYLLAQTPALAMARNSDGLSLALVALYHRRQQALDVILATGPRLDCFEAAALGQIDRIRELTKESRECATSYAADGFTALHLAAFFGHTPVVALLLDRGAEVNAAARNSQQVTPLHAAAAGGHLAICSMLIGRGADVNIRQAGGWTPLHAAAQQGNRWLVDLLLAGGADPSLANDQGETPAATAARGDHTALAEALQAASR